MLKVELKMLEGTKWERFTLNEAIDKSLVDVLNDCKKPAIGALFDDDKPVAFISNDRKYVEMYKDKGFSCLAEDLKTIMTPSGKQLELIASVFDDSTIKEVIKEN